MEAPAIATVIEEAAKKSDLVWLRATGPQQRSQAVWHVWHEGAAYILSGGIEQPVPAGLGDTALLIVRSKDKRSRLVTVEARVSLVSPDSEEWAAVEPLLRAKRLNSPDGDRAPGRWTRECTLYRIEPTDVVLESPDNPSTASHATDPPATPARTRVPRPLHLRGRPSRNRGGR